ncbi:Hypothetical protein R9X50_00509900 [Acrodontium crateriforme]|uniref:DUF1996 domain-containing protein n=1 Tax=Acrodontium crateriforme TaxID=150365 RepID=A0AAQ3M8R6_9PEZI|nr:Hypothetical protein R9X50_00509900 [Acrodontium crateriforme]
MFALTYPAVLTALHVSTVAAQQFVLYSAGGDDTAVERIDPILAPGSISQHVHQVFGSNALASSVSYDSLQSASCTTMGGAGNVGIKQDNSIYWHPALYMNASDGSGYIRVPTNGHKLYYKNAGSDNDKKRDPFEFPQGFRMLAGNPFMRKAASDLQQQNITQWICHDTASNQGTDGGFPTGVNNCASTDGFNGAIHFPHCWNGDDFDPSNPSAHVVYPTGDIENGECPSSHPTRLPHIFAENTFDMNSVYGKVVQDSFVLAQGDNTGYGWHADFYNGWEEGAIPAIMNSCPYREYGNEDAHECTAFVQRDVNPSDCKLSVTFKENVDTPGHALPGCNPIVDTNPAPAHPIAAINVATNVCGAAGAVAASTAASSAPASSSTNTPSSSAAVSASSSSQASVSVSSSVPTTLSSKISSAAAKSSSAAGSSPATSVVKASTASVASAASSSTAISCPASNGTIYTASNGDQFQIECGIDHHAGDMGSKTTTTLAACIAACASTTGCVDVVLSGVACYMKSSLGATEFNDGVSGAKLITSSSSKAKNHVQSQSFGYTVTVTQSDIVYVTDYITVTATPTAMMGRRAHAHLHGNAKRAI